MGLPVKCSKIYLEERAVLALDSCTCCSGQKGLTAQHIRKIAHSLLYKDKLYIMRIIRMKKGTGTLLYSLCHRVACFL